MARRVYKPALTSFLDTADPATVLRNALTASQPQNSIVVASGSLATVARLLALRGANLLIVGTVRHLVIADLKNADPKPLTDAQRVFAEWPTPIYLCGAEIGDAIRYPAASIENDFTGPRPNPFADAYRAFGEMPYDAPTTSADAGLFAVRMKANLLQALRPRNLPCLRRWAPSNSIPPPSGKHRRLILDEAQKDNVVKALTELASAPPRAGGGRRGARPDADAPANANQPAAVKKK